MSTYYFDGSDAAVTDPNAVWTNEANAFDGSTATEASVATGGSTSSNYMFAEGTNAPSTGTSINLVKARIFGDGDASAATLVAAIYTDGLGELLGSPSVNSASNAWGSYTDLSTPTGGWTWAKVQALEVKAYASVISDTSGQIMRIEIEVYSDPYPSTIYRKQGFQ